MAGEAAMHGREIDRLRAELVHLDATLRLFDPESDPTDVPTVHRNPKRTEWFARGEVTRRVYETLRDEEVVSPRKLTKRAWSKRAYLKPTGRSARTITALFTIVAYYPT
jgi:hypothetical protein